MGLCVNEEILVLVDLNISDSKITITRGSSLSYCNSTDLNDIILVYIDLCFNWNFSKQWSDCLVGNSKPWPKLGSHNAIWSSGETLICLSICCSNVLTFHGTSAPQSTRFHNYYVLVHVSLGFSRAEIIIIGCNLSRGGPARLETVVVWCIINVQMFTWTGVWSYDNDPMFRSRLLAPCFSDEVLLCACQT